MEGFPNAHWEIIVAVCDALVDSQSKALILTDQGSLRQNFPHSVLDTPRTRTEPRGEGDEEKQGAKEQRYSCGFRGSGRIILMVSYFQRKFFFHMVCHDLQHCTYIVVLSQDAAE